MKTPQKETTEFLRLHGCRGNNDLVLTGKLLEEWDMTQILGIGVLAGELSV